MPTHMILVLVVLFAIFALTSLLNRDTQPLPQRPSRGKGPGEPVGPDRSNPVSTTHGARRAEQSVPTLSRSVTERPFTGRWATPVNPSATHSNASFSGALDEGIRIIDDGRQASGRRGSNLPIPPSRKERGGLLRRSQRNRGPNASGLTPIDHERPKALAGLAQQALAQKTAKPLTASPLAFPMSPINSPLSQRSPDSVVDPLGKEGRAPAMSETQIRDLVASPARLREMIIMNVILQPPLCMQSREGPGRRRA